MLKVYNTASRRVEEFVPREPGKAGVYVPGGTAPLFSTVLMLATPAKIAGCRKVVLCSPPPVADEIVYAATLCGVSEISGTSRIAPCPAASACAIRCR